MKTMKMASKIKEVLEATEDFYSTEKRENQKGAHVLDFDYEFRHTPKGRAMMERVRLAEKDLAECILSYNVEDRHE